MIKFDYDKCCNDGICAAVCPLGLIIISKKTGRPAFLKGAENFCIKCGHCAAACPKAVISFEFYEPEKALKTEGLPAPEKLELFLRSRRSIRNFNAEKISRDIIEHLIETAGYAPTGHNSQPTKWLVFTEPKKLDEIKNCIFQWMKATIENNKPFADALHLNKVTAAFERGNDVILRDAPALVAAYCEKSNNMGASSATINLTYLELAAYANKLGACWAGYFHLATLFFPQMREVIGLTENFTCHGGMMLGYPAYKYARVPARKKQEIIWA